MIFRSPRHLKRQLISSDMAKKNLTNAMTYCSNLWPWDTWYPRPRLDPCQDGSGPLVPTWSIPCPSSWRAPFTLTWHPWFMAVTMASRPSLHPVGCIPWTLPTPQMSLGKNSSVTFVAGQIRSNCIYSFLGMSWKVTMPCHGCHLISKATIVGHAFLSMYNPSSRCTTV